MNRVMIIGGSGSGKSTLARKLGEIIDLPVIHIDKMYWKPGWVLRDNNELQDMILDAIQSDQWIFEGNNTASFEHRILRADTLIFIDMPVWLRLYRVIMRMITYYGKSRSDMAENCPERLDWEYLKFLKFVAEYGGRSRKQALALLDSAPEHGVRPIHLKTRTEVIQFLNAL